MEVSCGTYKGFEIKVKQLRKNDDCKFQAIIDGDYNSKIEITGE